MFKLTRGKISKSKKENQPRIKQARTGSVRDFICRPYILVALTMLFSYGVLLWMPTQLSAPQVTQMTAGLLLFIGMAAFGLMFRRARTVSKRPDKDGFLELATSFVMVALFAAFAVYVLNRNYAGFEVLQLSAVAMAMIIAIKLSPSRSKVVTPQRSSSRSSADQTAGDGGWVGLTSEDRLAGSTDGFIPETSTPPPPSWPGRSGDGGATRGNPLDDKGTEGLGLSSLEEMLSGPNYQPR